MPSSDQSNCDAHDTIANGQKISQRLPGLESLRKKKDIVGYGNLLKINGTRYLTLKEAAIMLQLKYPGETAPNASTITRLVQRFRDTGSVADRKQSGTIKGTASILKTKMADVETALQNSPMKISSVNINIVTEFISLLNSDRRYLGCSKTKQRVTHQGTVWNFKLYF
ncbi:DUF4817 domain-containing protein [Trichonephila clavipes]|uniref:DUF4817 domain-containing protein n=1 Tax=Trichonephila clavipes TaxID=2585209 RepID=A0A8X6SH21_TRICX|nr:DUF4817 domain-containing protein [Trichonephila clavipes]